jgi:hypothetical protein
MLSPSLPATFLPARPPPLPDSVSFDPLHPQPSAPSVNALAPAEKLDPRQPRALLLHAFKSHKLLGKPAGEQRHYEYLLNTPLGRDFTLITSDGVEFKVHMTMILGRSKVLQDGIFPGDVSAT